MTIQSRGGPCTLSPMVVVPEPISLKNLATLNQTAAMEAKTAEAINNPMLAGESNVVVQ